MAAINAKYIHSSLALRSLKAFFGDEKVLTAEFTINNDMDFIVSEIYKMKPDVLFLSVYIWNVEMVLNIISVMKKILPSVTIVTGGPEVSFEYEYLFDKGVDIVIIGEGEATFKELAEYFIYNNRRLSEIDGIAFIKDGKIIKTPERSLIRLDDIPFAYDDLSDMENRIIYYETSRGCPFNCAYCLSSVTQGVRFLSMERVLGDLKIFLLNSVRQVKFVDRTFNCNKERALKIWDFLINNDNGITNFHFEISADLIDDEAFSELKKARQGLFQFEIGVQSTNAYTLDVIERRTDTERLLHNVSEIKRMKNIHQHLDLIAGLPGEDYTSFGKSFNDVMSVFPEQIQLGFLKVLRGSGLKRDAKKYGLVYKDNAPYEILLTNEMSYAQMNKLKFIEEMVETYYNSGRCAYILRYSIPLFESAFDFFEGLAEFFEKNNYHHASHTKIKLYTILFEFYKETLGDTDIIKELLTFDIFKNDNLKTFPYWMDLCKDEELKSRVRLFFNDKEKVSRFLPELRELMSSQLNRACVVKRFNYDFIAWEESNFERLCRRETFILFNYYNGKAAAKKIEL